MHRHALLHHTSAYIFDWLHKDKSNDLHEILSSLIGISRLAVTHKSIFYFLTQVYYSSAFIFSLHLITIEQKQVYLFIRVTCSNDLSFIYVQIPCMCTLSWSSVPFLPPIPSGKNRYWYGFPLDTPPSLLFT